jgi:hypothetical protein
MRFEEKQKLDDSVYDSNSRCLSAIDEGIFTSNTSPYVYFVCRCSVPVS